jgi:hypothetical protein
LIASSFSLVNYNTPAFAQQSSKPTSSTTATDIVPPDTQITSAVDSTGKPVQNGGTTTANSITFTFRGIDNTGSGVSTFQCSFDNRPYSSCGSQINLPGLTVGSHGFAVAAVDSAGNIDRSPATFTWAVTNPEPEPASTDPTLTTNTVPTDKVSSRGAQSENIPIIDRTLDNTLCGGELVTVSGVVHIVSQVFPRSDGSLRINQHLNFADLTGVGEHSGLEYRASENANTEINIDIDDTGTETELAVVHLITVGPVQQPNLTVRVLIHITVNSDGTITSQILNLRSGCEGA